MIVVDELVKDDMIHPSTTQLKGKQNEHNLQSIRSI
jgi:hypothetical protein